jgi:small basic protein (TIGR04137 family)
MSQHPTLKVDSVGAKHRNVLSRNERIKKMQEQNKWQERASVYNLPKIKSMKIKVKKTKEAPAEGAAAPAAGGAAAAAKAPAGKAAPAAKAAEKPKK